MNTKRPVNLDLTTIKLPLVAYTSILHRAAGIILFVGIAFLLYAFSLSLHSAVSFHELKQTLSHPFAKIIIWGLLSSLAYHFVAGIKHILHDVEIGDTKIGGKISAQISLVISVVLVLLIGVWVW